MDTCFECTMATGEGGKKWKWYKWKKNFDLVSKYLERIEWAENSRLCSWARNFCSSLMKPLKLTLKLKIIISFRVSSIRKRFFVYIRNREGIFRTYPCDGRLIIFKEIFFTILIVKLQQTTQKFVLCCNIWRSKYVVN